MHKQIFVNLPIADMKRSRAFYESLGYTFNPEFTNDQGACMVLGDNLFAMLLVREFFATFTPRPVGDARKETQVLVCVDADSREAIDALVAKAVTAGGRTPRPATDHGFMYQHAYEDPDGHIWELVHMTGVPPKG